MCTLYGTDTVWVNSDLMKYQCTKIEVKRRRSMHSKKLVLGRIGRDIQLLDPVRDRTLTTSHLLSISRQNT